MKTRSYTHGGPPVPLVDPHGLTIHAETETLVSARVRMSSQFPFTIDTTGTNIQISVFSGDLELWGEDTVSNYQAVLRTLKVALQGWVGQSVFEISVSSEVGMPGIPAVSVIVGRPPGPPILGSSGAPAGILHEVDYYVGGEPVAIVPDDFSISLPTHAPHLNTLDAAYIKVYPAITTATFTVDTAGTGIHWANSSQGIDLSGTDTFENYERVLRSVRYTPPSGLSGNVIQIQITVRQAIQQSPPATTLVTIMAPPLPRADLNGPAAGHGFEVVARQGDAAVSIVDSQALTIDAPGRSVIRSAWIMVHRDIPGTLTVDTLDTEIVASPPSGRGLRLTGEASIEHYQDVLRTLRYSTAPGAEGFTAPIEIRLGLFPFLEPSSGVPSISMLTVLGPEPPILDINGELPGNSLDVAYYAFGSPARIAPRLEIESSAPLLSNARVEFDPARQPNFHYDTSGTNIVAVLDGPALVFSGEDTPENYLAVLRNLAVEYPGPPTGLTTALAITVSDGLVHSTAVNSLVTTLPLSPPIVDLNGPAPGVGGGSTSIYAGMLNEPLFNPELSIRSPLDALTHAQVYFGGATVNALVDTTGTNITANMSGFVLSLSGTDTVANYERVLRSITIQTAGTPPGMGIEVVVGHQFGQSFPSYLRMATLVPPPAILDLDGRAQYEHFETSYRVGGPAVPIVDSEGLSLHSPTGMLTGAYLWSWPGTLSVDTSGTNLSVEVVFGGLEITGQAPAAVYEQVLRTLTFETTYVGSSFFSTNMFVIDSFGQPSPLVQSIIKIDDSATIVDRYLFYNNSKLDGFTPEASPLDDAVIAPDKTPYVAGEGPATSSAVSSYWRGINGIMIDVANLAGPITPNDFTFRVGTNGQPDSWLFEPVPSQFLVRPGEGDGGSDRIVIIWPDELIKNSWLQVTLKGNDATGGFNTNTGLAASDVFYFGSRVGDTFVGAQPPSFLTNADDELGARMNTSFNVPLTNVYDFNRDGFVNADDQIIARANVGLLSRLNVPAGAAPLSLPVAAFDSGRAAAAASLATVALLPRIPAGLEISTAQLPERDSFSTAPPALAALENERFRREVFAGVQRQYLALALAQLGDEPEDELWNENATLR